MNMHPQGISRRDFVKGAAVTAASLPLIVPASALGAEAKKKAASDRITLGFIGMGYQCRGHLNHFLGTGEVQVLAVCDVDTKRREHAQKMVLDRYAKDKKNGKYQGCAAYNDFHDLLA